MTKIFPAFFMPHFTEYNLISFTMAIQFLNNILNE